MMLETSGLSAGYGRVQVLWNIDLQVDERGSWPWSVRKARARPPCCGPSRGWRGSWTAATFRGTALQGRSIESIVDLGKAHVPEGRRLFAGLTVRDNLLLGGWRRGKCDIDRVVELFPRLGERLGPGHRQHVRRGTADVRHRPRPDERARPDDDR
jgi:branched-chain amino acid transport system ATP-binding protein